MSRPPTSPEDRVRLAVKKLDYSIEALEDHLANNSGDFISTAALRGVIANVRIAVRVRRPDVFYKWAMSVIYNGQRIDGIDWEPTVMDHRGPKHNCRGWHRHIWKVKTADTLKECLPEFDPQSVREFLLNGFRLINVQLKKEERDREGKLFHS